MSSEIPKTVANRDSLSVNSNPGMTCRMDADGCECKFCDIIFHSTIQAWFSVLIWS